MGGGDGRGAAEVAAATAASGGDGWMAAVDAATGMTYSYKATGETKWN